MPSVTFSAAVESYLAGYSSAATVAAYRCDLALWHRYCDHHALDPLGDVVRADLERYARHLEHEGRAPATVARRLATLVGFYRRCADEHLIAHCPVLNLRRPRRPAESPRLGLSRTELADWLVVGEQVGSGASMRVPRLELVLFVVHGRLESQQRPSGYGGGEHTAADRGAVSESGEHLGWCHHGQLAG